MAGAGFLPDTIEKGAIVVCSLLATILPGVVKATHLDETIDAYRSAAAQFKVAEKQLRRTANVWSLNETEVFEREARIALDMLADARRFSLVPPEWAFRRAQAKVKGGDYEPDPVGP
jgi:hypothetical protein